jgi:tripartite-type tricarboxylate transporter receptor subunit TctC
MNRFTQSNNRVLRFARIAAAVVLAAAVTSVGAQTYPSKTMHMIVGFPPGGGSDAFARILGQSLSDQLGQQVIIDNRPGANGSIGAEVAARQPADGYNLLLISTSQAINVSLYAKLNYDLLKDFTPVAVVGSVPNTVVVKADLPVKNVKEYIALAKTRELTFASSGSGSPEHLAGEIFSAQAGIKMVHVPYKGSGQSVIDLAGGQVDSGFNTLPSVINMAKQGKVRVLAVTTSKRSATNPDIPTVHESGLPNYDMSTWFALVVPSATSPEIVKRLNDEVNKAIASKEMKARLFAIGADAADRNTVANANAFLRTEIEKFRKMVQALSLKND